MSDIRDVEIAQDFLHFMVDYYSLIRRHTVETNQFRVHSHGFSMLYALRNCKNKPITMTKFADEMGITKQQLTKLVNDLEDKGYVQRLHDNNNRRLVYIEITEEGTLYLEKMLGEIVHEIVRSLSAFDDADREKIIMCSRTFSEIFRRDAENCFEMNKNK